MSATDAAVHAGLLTAEQQAADAERKPTRHWTRKLRSAGAIHIVMVILLAALVLGAIFAPWLTPHNPEKSDLLARLTPPMWIEGGSSDHILGTDQLGRDILSRVMHGGRVSLLIAVIGTVFGVILGATLGLASGYAKGFLDNSIMLVVDAVISLPFIIIALAMVAALGSSFPVLVLLAVFAGFAGYTRVTRGLTMQIREQQYILAAQSIGAKTPYLIFRHVLPNVAAPLIVLTTMEMGSIVLLEASLSYLGFGIQPPTPAWGLMVNEGREYLHNAWWIGVFPGLAIMLLATSISMLGDLLRDVLDPNL